MAKKTDALTALLYEAMNATTGVTFQRTALHPGYTCTLKSGCGTRVTLGFGSTLTLALADAMLTHDFR